MEPGQGVFDERAGVQDGRSPWEAERSSVIPGWPRGWIAVGLGAGVLGAAALGLMARITLEEPLGVTSLNVSFLRDLLAASCWIPVGAGVVALARQVSFAPDRIALPALVHLIGIGAAALSVNILIAAVWWGVGIEPESAHIMEFIGAGTVRHIHANALIYLLLLALVHRIGPSGRGREGSVDPPVDEALDPRLLVGHGSRTVVVPLASVDWIEAAGDYAMVHADGRSHLLSERMDVIEARYGSRGFVRAHRSAIVNLAAILEIRSKPSGSGTLLLKSGQEVPLSRRRKDTVRRRLGVE